MKSINPYIILVFIFMALQGCNLQDPYNELFIPGEELENTSENYSYVEEKQNLENASLKSAGINTITIKGSFVVSSDSEPYPGSIVLLNITGVGNTSHMGRTNLVMEKTVFTDAYPNPPAPWNAVAEIIITTARGDELHCKYDHCTVDLSQPPNFVFQTKCTITGGTGRFEDATGTINYYEVFSWYESIGILKVNGVIYFEYFKIIFKCLSISKPTVRM